MGVTEELKQRRGLLLLTTEMQWQVGKACEAAGLADAARRAYAVMFLMMEEIDRIDQALAVVSQRTVEAMTVPFVCDECKKTLNAQVVATMLVRPDGDYGVETVTCDCGRELGQVRKDPPGVPVGYSLTVVGVMGAEKDGRTVQERMPEAEAIAKRGATNLADLPTVSELKAAVLMGIPVAVQNAQDPVAADLHAKLAAAKAKLGVRSDSQQEKPRAPAVAAVDDF